MGLPREGWAAEEGGSQRGGGEQRAARLPCLDAQHSTPLTRDQPYYSHNANGELSCPAHACRCGPEELAVNRQRQGGRGRRGRRLTGKSGSFNCTLTKKHRPPSPSVTWSSTSAAAAKRRGGQPFRKGPPAAPADSKSKIPRTVRQAWCNLLWTGFHGISVCWGGSTVRLSGSVQPFFGFACASIPAQHGSDTLCVFLGLMRV